MPYIRLTAAKSSQLTTKSGNKRPKPPEAPLLPSDKAYLKTIEENQRIRTDRKKERQEKLEIIPGPVDIEWLNRTKGEKNPKLPLLDAMDVIQTIMWNGIPSTGFSRKRAAEVHYYRTKTLPKLIMATQLYSIFLNNSTHVEREIRRNCSDNKIRKLQVNQIEGGELIIRTHDYEKALKSQPQNQEVFRKFSALLHSIPEATTVSIYDLQEYDLDTTKNILLSSGFLTLLPGQFDSYNISVPSLGAYLGLVSHCRKWVLKTLGKAPWKEMLESMLKDRWESYKSYWKDYKGASIEWVLCDAYGGGWIEPFRTPVGRGWKATGKT